VRFCRIARRLITLYPTVARSFVERRSAGEPRFGGAFSLGRLMDESESESERHPQPCVQGKAHHYTLDATGVGACIHCGALRKFQTYLEALSARHHYKR
jgi:hypothetical protein